MPPFIQLRAALHESAGDELEALLAKQVCPAHPGTTIGASDRCAMCDLDEAMFRAAVSGDHPAGYRLPVVIPEWAD